MHEGRYSLTVQTITTSLTLPSHTSMLTGVDADVHGVTWNSDKTKEKGYVAVPTMFGLAHSAGFVTAAFFSKTKFHQLEVPFTLDYERSPTGGGFNSLFSETRTTGYLGAYLEHGRGHYTVILTADHGGHGSRHGTTDPRDMTIPWIVWGAGVHCGDTLSGIRTMDTAATVLWLLGVVAPQNWVGRPVTRAFESTVVNAR
jgi:arylsulfatase A-like enzyme